MAEAGILLLAFVLGAIPFSNLVATRARGVDLRSTGTGTVSGTALYRVAGFRWLVVSGILDVTKGTVGPLLAGSGRPALAALAGGVAVSGPNLETRAEYRFLRAIGADVVGMSTVPETLVAVHMGMKVLGIAIVTDKCLPDALKPANITEIIRIANEAEPKLSRILSRFISEAKL